LTGSGMAPPVFISYASSDQAVAERLCGALETAGLACWMAPRNIEPGTDYPVAIVEAILSARVLLLVLTESAAASPHVLSEVGHAFNSKKRIIPFRISQKSLPEDLEYFLSLTQWLDAPDGCTDRNLKRLIEATQAALSGAPISRPSKIRTSRGRWLAGAAVMLVLAAGTIIGVKWRKAPHGAGGPPKTTDVTTLPRPTPPTASQVRTWTNPADGLNYVWIPPGRFRMGCSEQDSECQADEKPPHPVTIGKGFWLGQTEVTVVAYMRKAASSDHPALEGDEAFPISGVSWTEAKDYCVATGGRLPTEAEWEYAARGGSSQAYYGVISEIAWYANNSGDRPHEVGKKQPNAFGLYDMLGNVPEWVLDRYFDKYSLDAPATGPEVEQPLASNALAVARGGFWHSDAAGLRVSHRIPREKEGNDLLIGFRCANDHF